MEKTQCFNYDGNLKAHILEKKQENRYGNSELDAKQQSLAVGRSLQSLIYPPPVMSHGNALEVIACEKDPLLPCPKRLVIDIAESAFSICKNTKSNFCKFYAATDTISPTIKGGIAESSGK